MSPRNTRNSMETASEITNVPIKREIPRRAAQKRTPATQRAKTTKKQQAAKKTSSKTKKASAKNVLDQQSQGQVLQVMRKRDSTPTNTTRSRRSSPEENVSSPPAKRRKFSGMGISAPVLLDSEPVEFELDPQIVKDAFELSASPAPEKLRKTTIPYLPYPPKSQIGSQSQMPTQSSSQRSSARKSSTPISKPTPPAINRVFQPLEEIVESSQEDERIEFPYEFTTPIFPSKQLSPKRPATPSTATPQSEKQVESETEMSTRDQLDSEVEQPDSEVERHDSEVLDPTNQFVLKGTRVKDLSANFIQPEDVAEPISEWHISQGKSQRINLSFNYSKSSQISPSRRSQASHSSQKPSQGGSQPVVRPSSQHVFSREPSQDFHHEASQKSSQLPTSQHSQTSSFPLHLLSQKSTQLDSSLPRYPASQSPISPEITSDYNLSSETLLVTSQLNAVDVPVISRPQPDNRQDNRPLFNPFVAHPQVRQGLNFVPGFQIIADYYDLEHGTIVNPTEVGFQVTTDVQKKFWKWHDCIRICQAYFDGFGPVPKMESMFDANNPYFELNLEMFNWMVLRVPIDEKFAMTRSIAAKLPPRPTPQSFEPYPPPRIVMNAYSQEKGWKMENRVKTPIHPTIEDGMSAASFFHYPSGLWYQVYIVADGHGGTLCTDFIIEQFMLHIPSTLDKLGPDFTSDRLLFSNHISDLIKRVDAAYIRYFEDIIKVNKTPDQGSTLNIAMILPDTATRRDSGEPDGVVNDWFFHAHVGDTRTALYEIPEGRKSLEVCFYSEDHDPGHPVKAQHLVKGGVAKLFESAARGTAIKDKSGYWTGKPEDYIVTKSSPHAFRTTTPASTHDTWTPLAKFKPRKPFHPSPLPSLIQPIANPRKLSSTREEVESSSPSPLPEDAEEAPPKPIYDDKIAMNPDGSPYRHYRHVEGLKNARVGRPNTFALSKEQLQGAAIGQHVGVGDTMGDYQFKVDPPIFPCQPDIAWFKLSPQKTYEFVIATDGLWDSMSSGYVDYIKQINDVGGIMRDYTRCLIYEWKDAEKKGWQVWAREHASDFAKFKGVDGADFLDTHDYIDNQSTLTAYYQRWHHRLQAIAIGLTQRKANLFNVTEPGRSYYDDCTVLTGVILARQGGYGKDASEGTLSTVVQPSISTPKRNVNEWSLEATQSQ